MGCTDFMEWVIGNGGQHFGVDIRDCANEGGKGLFATTDFRENETIMCIPMEIIITAGFVAEIPGYFDVFKSRERAELEVDSLLQSASEIILNAGQSTPNFGTRKFSILFKKAVVCAEGRTKDNFVGILADSTIWDRFLWAWHIVNTRCIYRDNKPHPLIDNTESDSLAIVPLIDMLNHNNDSQCCAIWDSKLNLYKAIVTRPIREGEQIFICYGTHTNGSLWIEYGFYLKDNICNKVEISLGRFNFGHY